MRELAEELLSALQIADRALDHSGVSLSAEDSTIIADAIGNAQLALGYVDETA